LREGTLAVSYVYGWHPYRVVSERAWGLGGETVILQITAMQRHDGEKADLRQRAEQIAEILVEPS
jgi:hypothetical protein